MRLFFARLGATLLVLTVGLVVTILTGSLIVLGITLLLTVGTPKIVGSAQKSRVAK